MTTPDIKGANTNSDNLRPLNFNAIKYFEQELEVYEPSTQQQLIDYLNEKPKLAGMLATGLTAGAMIVGSYVSLAHYSNEIATAFHSMQILT
jgi:hypothetical protein